MSKQSMFNYLYNHWRVGIGIVAVFIVAGVYYNYTTTETMRSSPPSGEGSSVLDSLIEDRIAEYRIMQNQNAMPDQCGQAKMISMLYLQKQDEGQYANWSGIADACEQAYIESQTSI